MRMDGSVYAIPSFVRELLHHDHALGGGVADLDEIDAGGGHVEDGGLLGVEGGADEAAEVVEDAYPLVGSVGDEDRAVGGSESNIVSRSDGDYIIAIFN